MRKPTDSTITGAYFLTSGARRSTFVRAPIAVLSGLMEYTESFFNHSIHQQSADAGWCIQVLEKSPTGPEPVDIIAERIDGGERLMKVDVTRECLYVFGADGSRTIRDTLFFLTDILRWEAAATTTCYMHASAAATTIGAILFIGATRTGKTNLLMGLLHSAQSELIGDNNISVQFSDAENHAIGWPTPATVRRSAITSLTKAFPNLDRVFTFDRAEHPGLLSHRDIVSIFPKHFRHVGIRVTRSAPIAALIFPALSDDPHMEPQLRQMDEDEARREIVYNWDVIPERRPGGNVPMPPYRDSAWASVAFHEFTVEAFRSKIDALICANPRGLISLYPAYSLHFGEKHLQQAVHILCRELGLSPQG